MDPGDPSSAPSERTHTGQAPQLRSKAHRNHTAKAAEQGQKRDGRNKSVHRTAPLDNCVAGDTAPPETTEPGQRDECDLGHQTSGSVGLDYRGEAAGGSSDGRPCSTGRRPGGLAGDSWEAGKASVARIPRAGAGGKLRRASHSPSALSAARRSACMRGRGKNQPPEHREPLL